MIKERLIPKTAEPKERLILKSADLTEQRAYEDEGRKLISGYAAVFNQRSKLIFESGKLFHEIIHPGAFDEVLQRADLDVVFVYQHDRNEPLARYRAASTNNTLQLSVDQKGLRYEAVLPNTTRAMDTWNNVLSGNIFESSFRFTVKGDGQSWEYDSDGTLLRHIYKVDNLFDVSVVVDGAYANTDLEAAERSFQEFEAPKDTYYDQLWIEILELEN